VSSRVSPSERLRAQIDEVFAGGEDLALAIERVARLGAQLLLQAALGAEVSGFIGRDRYQRAAAVPDAAAGMRNGYAPVTVKTTSGPVTLARPKLRGTSERFASQLLGAGVTKTNALEALVIASYVRVCPLGTWKRRWLRRSVSTPVCPGRRCRGSARRSRSQFDTWRSRRLDDVRLDLPCSSTGRTSATTPTPPPGRCWPPGASTPTASRSSSAWTPPRPSRPTRGPSS
jgi:putative transposase